MGERYYCRHTMFIKGSPKGSAPVLLKGEAVIVTEIFTDESGGRYILCADAYRAADATKRYTIPMRYLSKSQGPPPPGDERTASGGAKIF
jgi:hypothetical protein